MTIRSKSSFFILALAVGLVMTIALNESDAQIKRSKRDYNTHKNKRITHYRGGAINFKKEKRYWSGGIMINSTNYFGDLTPSTSFLSTDISSTRLGVGATGTYRIWSNISLGGALSWNRIHGDDFSAKPTDINSGIYRYNRNLHFRNDLIELSGFGIVDFLHNRGTYFVRPPWVPYAFLGLAVFYHNPKAIVPEFDTNGAPMPDAGKWVALRPLGTEGQRSSEYKIKNYSPIQIAIPFGLGIRYKLNNYLDMEFEMSYRFLFTDYIDDVSRNYVDPGALDSELARVMASRSLEPVAAFAGKERIVSTDTRTITSRFDDRTYTVLSGYGYEGNVRGNPGDNDHYIVTSLKLKYILHAKARHAKFR